MTRRGAWELVGATVALIFFLALLARFSNGPMDFFGTIGLLFAFFALFLSILAIIGTRWVRLARELRRSRPDSTVFQSFKCGALTRGLIAMRYRDELLAGLSPENFPTNLVCSLEDDGIRLWTGARRAPRLLLAVPWRDCTKVGVDIRFPSGSKYLRVLLISTSRATLILPVMGGPLAVFRADEERTAAIHRDAVERWQRGGGARPMVSANSAAFTHLWSRLAPKNCDTALSAEDYFDDVMSLLQALSCTPEVRGIPAVIDNELIDHRVLVSAGIDRDVLLETLIETHALQR